MYQKSVEYQKSEKLSSLTMGKRINELKAFLDYIDVRYKKVFRVSKSITEVHMKLAAKNFAKRGKKESHAVKERNFARLPPMELVQEIRQKLIGIMDQNNTDTLRYLTVNEQMNVAFFIVHSRTNYRAGGLDRKSVV